MWYIFPQIAGLDTTVTSSFYALKDLDETATYLEHQLLGVQLIQICEALLKLEINDAHAIFGTPDDLKLKSSNDLI